jgi:hypothetical protein
MDARNFATGAGVMYWPRSLRVAWSREAVTAILEASVFTIENIKPGKPLDLSVVREINKLETKKNRLIVARFASLLKKSGPEVQAIVHQIIEI